MKRNFRMWLVALGFLATACGEDGSQSPWQFDEPNAQEEDSECEEDTDCGEDSYCHEPSDCFTPRYCAEGYAPISAAPPRTACSCDGTVISVNAGYPGRHAWIVGEIAGLDPYGQPCNESARPPFEFDLSYQIDSFDGNQLDGSQFEGVMARISDDFETDEPRMKPVADDGTVSWKASTANIYPNYSLEIFEDTNRDGGGCSDGDRLFTNGITEINADLVNFIFEFQVVPSAYVSHCADR